MAIELQPFTRDDISRLIGWIPSPDFLMLWAGALFRFPLDDLQFELYINSAEGDNPMRRIYRVVQDGEVIGHIELNNLNLEHRTATLSRVLIGNTALRGQGIGAQMIEQVLAIGFGQLNLHRIDLVVFDFNQPALRLYEKLGFVREGHLRDVRRVGENYWSLIQMSMLEDEWKARYATPAP